jgi:hypothetical protein
VSIDYCLSPRRKKIEFEIEDYGCFICTSHGRDVGGYPQIRVNRSLQAMSRFVYKEMFGEIPEGHVIRHKCDNRACINPEHLLTGTKKENSRDMVIRKRTRPVIGERNKNAKLTERKVRVIRDIYKKGEMNKSQLARLYNVSHTTINDAITEKWWGHVD